jgi:hypothetical protein
VGGKTAASTAGTAAGTGGTAVAQGAGGAAGQGTSKPAVDAGSQSKDAGSMHDAKVATASDAGTKPTGAVTTLRVTELYLRDPHFFLNGMDITDQGLLAINGNIQNGLTMDYDGDTFIDNTFLLHFQPLDPAASNVQLQLTDGNCAVNAATKCMPKAQPGLDVSWTLDNKATGACLTPVANTTSAFTPAVGTPMGPCFVTSAAKDIVITLGGIRLPLVSARLAASYDGSPPKGLMTGLISGFVTKAEAMKALLPSYLLTLAGTPLSDYLRAQDADMAASPNGMDGFWLYVNFVAAPVDFTG